MEKVDWFIKTVNRLKVLGKMETLFLPNKRQRNHKITKSNRFADQFEPLH